MTVFRMGLGVVALAVTAAVAAVSAWAGPDDVAVIVGNKTYKSVGTPEVAYAHNDADAFKKYAMEVLDIPERNIIDLRDVTLNQMVDVFGSRDDYKGTLYRWARPNKSSVVVYYSGHGVPGEIGGATTGAGQADGYLLPVDANPAKARDQGYPVSLLQSNLEKLKAERLPGQSLTLVLDACFSGNSPKGSLVQGVSGNFGIAVDLPPSAKEIVRLTAASARQTAVWDDMAKHGMFTAYLLRGLYGAADKDRDGRVTVGEIKAWLDDEMSYCVGRSRGMQQDATVAGDAKTVLASLAGRGVSTPSWRGACDPVQEVALSPDTRTHVPSFNDIARRQSEAKKVNNGLYSLSIGINKYTRSPLRGAVEDALDISAAAKHIGARTAEILLDHDATKQNIINHMHSIIDRSPIDSTILISFSGHANTYEKSVKIGGSTEVGEYIVTADFSDVDSSKWKIYDFEIEEIVNYAKPRNIILLFDTMYAGAMANNSGRLQNVLYIGATDNNGVALEINVGGSTRGALSWAFSRALYGNADFNSDKITTKTELINFLRQKTGELTNGRQEIVITGGASIDFLIKNERLSTP